MIKKNSTNRFRIDNNIKKGEKMFYQQGDVLIKKVLEVEGQKVEHKVLAEGEVTGHAHRVIEGATDIYEHKGTLFMKVFSDEAVIAHEEHKFITVKKGNYQIDIVQEYDHFAEEARNVAD